MAFCRVRAKIIIFADKNKSMMDLHFTGIVIAVSTFFADRCFSSDCDKDRILHRHALLVGVHGFGHGKHLRGFGDGGRAVLVVAGRTGGFFALDYRGTV